MVREVKRNEVEEEIRKQVDNLMRDELDLLKIVSRFHEKFVKIFLHFCLVFQGLLVSLLVLIDGSSSIV